MVSADDAMAAVVDVMAGPWVWGQSDCCAAACDVFARLWGIDPMAPLRGRYASRRAAWRLVRAAGGWLALAPDLAARAGLVDGTGAPGEIGLLRQPTGYLLGVSVGHGQWAARIDGGFATTDCAELAWTVRR